METDCETGYSTQKINKERVETMARELRVNLDALSNEEREEVARLRESKEVRLGREAEKAKQYLYGLRRLYKKGKKVLEAIKND